jgi:hypothetical protein
LNHLDGGRWVRAPAILGTSKYMVLGRVDGFERV